IASDNIDTHLVGHNPPQPVVTFVTCDNPQNSTQPSQLVITLSSRHISQILANNIASTGSGSQGTVSRVPHHFGG
ncbi:hypothetical protein Moror_12877, partial [Moniliophthora roreri MCA 2997]